MLRLVGNRITLGLQFLDRAVELVHRRADVRQLDDVGVRLQRQLAKLGQIVRHALRFGEVFREQAKEACGDRNRSEEHTSELQSLMRISYAVFCLKKTTQNVNQDQTGQQKTTQQ